MALFNPYRGFILQNGQITMDELANMSNFNKKELLRNMMRKLEKESKVTYTDSKENVTVLYFYRKINEDIIILQFARKKHLKIRIPKENCIEEDKEDDFPYIYVILDLKTQVFLFEHKSTVFYSTKGSKNAFMALFNYYLRKYNCTIEFEKILDQGEFWHYIDMLDKINIIKLSLNSPNLFGGIFATNELLERLRKLYNNKKFEFTLINKENTLKNINKDDMDDSIRYIENGGGNWSIEGKDNKQNIIKRNSEELIKKVVIENIEDEEIMIKEIGKINKGLFEKSKKD